MVIIESIVVYWVLCFSSIGYTLAEIETWDNKGELLERIYRHMHGGRDANEYKLLPSSLFTGIYTGWFWNATTTRGTCCLIIAQNISFFIQLLYYKVKSIGHSKAKVCSGNCSRTKYIILALILAYHEQISVQTLLQNILQKVFIT